MGDGGQQTRAIFYIPYQSGLHVIERNGSTLHLNGAIHRDRRATDIPAQLAGCVGQRRERTGDPTHRQQ